MAGNSDSAQYSLSDALRDVTDAVWVIAPDSTIAYANRSAVRFHADMFGSRLAVGLPVSDLYPEEVRQRWTDRYRAAAGGKPVFTLEAQQSEGEEAYFELLFDRASPATSGFPVVVIARPITDRHRTMCGTALEARTIIDSDTFVVYASPQFKELLGISSDTPIKSLRLKDLLDPDDESVLLEAVSNVGFEPQRIERLRVLDSSGRVHHVVGAIARSPDTGNLSVTLLDVTTQTETEQKLEQQAEHLRALHAWAADLNVYMDQPELLYNRSLELLRNAVRYDSASIQVRSGDDLTIVASAGFEKPDEVTGLQFPFDAKYPNWHVVTSRQLVAVTEVAKEYPHFQELSGQYHSADIATWLGVPLAVGDEVLGMIALDRAEPLPFSEEEQRLVITMAGHIAVAVNNAQLYGELRTSEHRLTETNAQKEVLLRELHHRSKNNMQMITSLLSLGAASVALEEDGRILDEVRMRIQSLAAIHEELYRADNLDSVDLGEYARRLVRMISDSYGRPGVQTSIDSKGVFTSIDVSVPFGLILSELVLNAYKHAFPGEKEGTIAVEVTSDDRGGQLTVRDDGVGVTRADLDRQSDSLGMQLVTSLVDQIGGELDLANGPGTRWVIRFPVTKPRISVQKSV